MQRKKQQSQNLSARMPTHEQQRQNATGADDRYNSGAGASGNTYAQQGVGGYAQQVSSPSPRLLLPHSRNTRLALIRCADRTLTHSLLHVLVPRDTTIRTRTRSSSSNSSSSSSTRTPDSGPRLTSSSLHMPGCRRISRTGTLPSGRGRTRRRRTAVPLRR